MRDDKKPQAMSASPELDMMGHLTSAAAVRVFAVGPLSPPFVFRHWSLFARRDSFEGMSTDDVFFCVRATGAALVLHGVRVHVRARPQFNNVSGLWDSGDVGVVVDIAHHHPQSVGHLDHLRMLGLVSLLLPLGRQAETIQVQPNVPRTLAVRSRRLSLHRGVLVWRGCGSGTMPRLGLRKIAVPETHDGRPCLARACSADHHSLAYPAFVRVCFSFAWTFAPRVSATRFMLVC